MKIITIFRHALDTLSFFVAVHFTCTSPLSQRIISYVLGSTYLEILRDDLTNIIIIFYAVFKEQYSDINLSIHASYVAINDSLVILV